MRSTDPDDVDFIRTSIEKMLQKGHDKNPKDGESKANSEDSDSEEENEEGSIRSVFTKFIRTAHAWFFSSRQAEADI